MQVPIDTHTHTHSTRSSPHAYNPSLRYALLGTIFDAVMLVLDAAVVVVVEGAAGFVIVLAAASAAAGRC